MIQALSLAAAACLQAGPTDPGPRLAAEDARYFRVLARDTWLSIRDLVEPSTGLPCDDSERGDQTSVSNIGILLTCHVCASRMGFLTRKEAAARTRKTLATLAKFKTFHGFQQSWHGVKTLAPNPGDPWVSLLDSGNLCAGLITAAEAFPEAAPEARRLLKAMDWGAFYDREQKALIGGLNGDTGKLNPKWRLDALGTDAALAQFLAVASGGAPPSLWKGLNRRTIEWEGQRFLWPGWDGGGLFMQFISGLWLDLKGTELGDSGERFARAQIQHARSIGAPAWGWSACSGPDGAYLGWGALKDEIVTPHACVLASRLFPAEAAASLRAMERLGARSVDRGFYDSVNWKTGRRSNRFLALDQGMILISLTSLLEGGHVHRLVERDPLIQAGRRLLDFPSHRKEGGRL